MAEAPGLGVASIFSPKTISEAPQDFHLTYTWLKSTSTLTEPIRSTALGVVLQDGGCTVAVIG